MGGFNECFFNCSNNVGPAFSDPPCAGFSFGGPSDGDDSAAGICFFKRGNDLSFQADYNVNIVGAIIVSGLPGDTATTTASTLSLSSSTSESFLTSSEIIEVTSATTDVSFTSSSSSSLSSSTDIGAPSTSTGSPTCTADDRTIFTDTTGREYIVLCQTDSEPGSYIGNGQSDFVACMNACSTDTTSECVAVTFIGGQCYRKDSVSAYSSGTGALAVLLSYYDGGLAVSSSTTAGLAVSTTSSQAVTSGFPTVSLEPSQSDDLGGSSTVPPFSSTASGNTETSVPNSSPLNTATTSPQLEQPDTSSTSTGAGSGDLSTSATELPSSASQTPTTFPGQSNEGTSAAPISGSTLPTSNVSSGETPSSFLVTDSPATSPVTSSVLPGTSTVSYADCASSSCTDLAANSSTCEDLSGSSYSVTCGVRYMGRRAGRATRPNLGACLVLCDDTPDCEAVNYYDTTCEIVTDVDGSFESSGGVAALRSDEEDMMSTKTGPASMGSSMMQISIATSDAPSNSVSYSGGQSLSHAAPTPSVSSPSGAPQTSESVDAPSSSFNVPSQAPSSGLPASQSGASSQHGSPIVSFPTQAQTSASAVPTVSLCPSYNGLNHTDSMGSTYTLYCDQAYVGSRLQGYAKERRQAPYDLPVSLSQCLAQCNLYVECVAVTADNTGCNLYTSITGLVASSGAESAVKVPVEGGQPPSNIPGTSSATSITPGGDVTITSSPPPNNAGVSNTGASTSPTPTGGNASQTGGAEDNVVTVTVCGPRMRTTTFFTTMWPTTCAASLMCTAMQGAMNNGVIMGRDNRFIAL